MRKSKRMNLEILGSICRLCGTPLTKENRGTFLRLSESILMAIDCSICEQDQQVDKIFEDLEERMLP